MRPGGSISGSSCLCAIASVVLVLGACAQNPGQESASAQDRPAVDARAGRERLWGRPAADAPDQPTGNRHCVNGTSLIFVPEGEDVNEVLRADRKK